MIRLLLPLLVGFGIDCLLGDPHGLPHPVVLIGKTISALERALRKMFPKTPRGERGAVGDRERSCSGDSRDDPLRLRKGESVAAPCGRERDVLADFGGKIAA